MGRAEIDIRFKNDLKVNTSATTSRKDIEKHFLKMRERMNKLLEEREKNLLSEVCSLVNFILHVEPLTEELLYCNIHQQMGGKFI